MTSVINIKSKQPYDIYIGRAVPRKGLAASKWANPYRVGKDGPLDLCLARYQLYLMQQPDLVAQMGELEGKTLGCWCSPLPCHGQILAALAGLSEEGRWRVLRDLGVSAAMVVAIHSIMGETAEDSQ